MCSLLYLAIPVRANGKENRKKEKGKGNKVSLALAIFLMAAPGKGVNSLSCRGVGSSAVRKVLGRDHLLSRD